MMAAPVTCYHCGEAEHAGVCPRVQEIEYFDNGRIKRVVYFQPQIVALGSADVSGKRRDLVRHLTLGG